MNYFLINLFIFSPFLFKFLEAKNYLIKRSFDDYDGGDSPPLFIDWTQPRINPAPNSFYYKNKPYSATENGERIYPHKNGKEKGDYGPFGVGLVGLMKGEGKEESESSPLSWLKGLLFGG
uniref:Candidate secreted effector n=1 Tax=Meloidogyne incognita TaxID=6306 RepID=A0A914N7B0_MELIC